MTVDRENPLLGVNPSALSAAEPYRPVLREIDIPKRVEEDEEVEEEEIEDVLVPKESPMSLDRSLILTGSGKKDSRTKREVCKASRANFYDIDEYRADIYHYFRSAEVSINLTISRAYIFTLGFYLTLYFVF